MILVCPSLTPEATQWSVSAQPVVPNYYAYGETKTSNDGVTSPLGPAGKNSPEDQTQLPSRAGAEAPLAEALLQRELSGNGDDR